MTTIAEQIAAHFGSLPTLEPESVAVRYQGTETSWGQLGLVADGILECLAAAGGPEGSSLGWIARNDPALLGALGRKSVVEGRGVSVRVSTVGGRAIKTNKKQ